jgi:hypothetical protein
VLQDIDRDLSISPTRRCPQSYPRLTYWKTVDVRLDEDALMESGESEDIKQSFLPLFTTRKVECHSTCIPHQEQPGGMTLRLEVLIAGSNDAKSLATPFRVRQIADRPRRLR